MERTPPNTPPEDGLPQELRAAYAEPFVPDTQLFSPEYLRSGYEIDGLYGPEPTDRFALRGLISILAEEIHYQELQEFNPFSTPQIKWKAGAVAVASEILPPISNDQHALAA